jgi:hypothetical protein
MLTIKHVVAIVFIDPIGCFYKFGLADRTTDCDRTLSARLSCATGRVCSEICTFDGTDRRPFPFCVTRRSRPGQHGSKIPNEIIRAAFTNCGSEQHPGI